MDILEHSPDSAVLDISKTSSIWSGFSASIALEFDYVDTDEMEQTLEERVNLRLSR